MYPSLYYIFKDIFGSAPEWTKVLHVFGLMVALAFGGAVITLSRELKRKEKEGLLRYREESIISGKPASLSELIFNGLIGFLFGYKILGLIFFRPVDVDPQEYIFSSAGSILGGLAVGGLLAFLKWKEKNKTKLATPERRTVRIWPHDRVGDIFIIALVGGIVGAKLFDGIEHWNTFISNPIGYLLSGGGLAFYGGLIVAAIAVIWYAKNKRIDIRHLIDAAAPGLMLAYAIGRIGCQLSGDGDWGVFNSAYTSDLQGNVQPAAPGAFEKQLQANSSYVISGDVTDADGKVRNVTDRVYGNIENAPRKFAKAPSFLPDKLFAQTYPRNVNEDGVIMPGVTDKHNRVLPLPVFPTPLYETLICGFFFLMMWMFRRKIKVPMVMFGVYLVLNGLERFVVENIRVNKLYNVLGFHLSQAEIIALILMLLGIGLITYAYRAYQSAKE